MVDKVVAYSDQELESTFNDLQGMLDALRAGLLLTQAFYKARRYDDDKGKKVFPRTIVRSFRMSSKAATTKL